MRVKKRIQREFLCDEEHDNICIVQMQQFSNYLVLRGGHPVSSLPQQVAVAPCCPPTIVIPSGSVSIRMVILEMLSGLFFSIKEDVFWFSFFTFFHFLVTMLPSDMIMYQRSGDVRSLLQ